jgi:hypothetical protein
MIRYFALGGVFGIVLIKSEVVSWFRIQEMFRFQSFHMYGVIGAAVVVAGLSLALLEIAGVPALTGEAISIPPRTLGKGYRYWIGGPLFALTGAGVSVYLVAALSALAGTWVYGSLRPRLPHY